MDPSSDATPPIRRSTPSFLAALRAEGAALRREFVAITVRWDDAPDIALVRQLEDVAARMRDLIARSLPPAERADPDRPPLTRQQRRILQLVAEGLTNDEIARRLSRSPGTVKKHLDDIYARMAVHDRLTAARLARERGELD